jgi:MerR family transcriptional regulator, copper efflux regulator
MALDRVIESLEYEIYKVKKDVYMDMKEWEALLKYISEDRLFEIKENPKGPGDLLIKELAWIKEYEERIE